MHYASIIPLNDYILIEILALNHVSAVFLPNRGTFSSVAWPIIHDVTTVLVLVLVTVLIFILVLVPLLLLLLLPDHHPRSPTANRNFLRVIPPPALDIHVPLLLALVLDIRKFLHTNRVGVEADESTHVHALLPPSATFNLQLTTMRVRMGIFVHLRNHETTAFVEFVVRHFRGDEGFPGGLRPHDFVRFGDAHGRYAFVFGIPAGE
mmetsp:Transcript_9148/g.19748  ORF Transcript_9148/g.19748 Transcript_9148/m.19748 type:complete len:207 (+) Transcript_9148:1109-1729(+)